MRLGSWTQRQRQPVTCVAFVQGSQALLTSCDDGSVSLWDLKTGQRVRQFIGHEKGVKCVAVAPDGKTIASSGWEGTVRLWELDTGKLLNVLRGHTQGVSSVVFSPDGKWLASGGSDAVVRLWNLRDGGKEEQKFHIPGGRPVSVAISPDGKTLAAGGTDATVTLWRLPSGDRLGTMKHEHGWILHLTFAPDGKTLATGGNGGAITLWDLATLKLNRRFLEKAEVLSVAFSPDGRTLASVTYDGGTQLWEVATGQQVWTRRGHASGVLSVAYADDGMTVASGSSDTTALIWDVTELQHEGQLQAKPLPADELEKCWRDLADANAETGQRAVWRLVANPTLSLPLIQERLKPVTQVEAEKLRQLVRDLDANRFAVRERAMTELERLDQLAVPALEQAQQSNPSAEAGRRISTLLNKLARSSVPPARLRGLRSFQVLEQVGSPDAMHILKDLANGPAESTLTQEAKASLDRIRQRKAQP
jgi:hypothetical protein